MCEIPGVFGAGAASFARTFEPCLNCCGGEVVVAGAGLQEATDAAREAVQAVEGLCAAAAVVGMACVLGACSAVTLAFGAALSAWGRMR